MDRHAIMRDLRDSGLEEIAEVDPDKRYIFSIYVKGYMNGEDYTQEEILELYGFVKDKVGDHDCQVIPTSASVEIIPMGVNKGTGIRAYCEKTGNGLSESVFLCDSNNDIPGAETVKEGGGKVYVVGNGVEPLKEMADYVAENTYWEGALEILNAIDFESPGEGVPP